VIIRPRIRVGLALVAALGAELQSLRGRGYRRPWSVIVRCRQGHLFSTIWVPGASVKALRLGPRRFQRCPVGRHWTLVRPVRAESLSEQELTAARKTRDIRLP
jgi:hypothetical protein